LPAGSVVADWQLDGAGYKSITTVQGCQISVGKEEAILGIKFEDFRYKMMRRSARREASCVGDPTREGREEEVRDQRPRKWTRKLKMQLCMK
jgi:hypothetical protein